MVIRNSERLRGFKSQNFHSKCATKLEFLDGLGGEGGVLKPKQPSVGGMDIFWNHTMDLWNKLLDNIKSTGQSLNRF